MKVLFENEYCAILSYDGKWVRLDKVLMTAMEVDSYFNEVGQLVKN